MKNTPELKKELIDIIKNASDNLWKQLGAKFGELQTQKDINYISRLSIFDKDPNAQFRVIGTTFRTRGYEIYCELDVVLFKKDGTEYNNSSIFGSIILPNII